MHDSRNVRRFGLIGTLLVATAVPVVAMAADPVEALQRQVDMLQKQLNELRSELQQQKQAAAQGKSSDAEIKDLKQQLREVSKEQSEAKEVNSVVHLTGYGAIGFSDAQNSDGTFSSLSFNPIFHYQYKDLFLLEAELELQAQDDGSTKTALEYGAIDWFVNDYMVLQAGKFLSPIGQFRQNLHPAWINKFASIPPGFGEDGAAPESDIGVQVRGGLPVGDAMRVNYSLYTGNGPMVELNGNEVEAIAAEGSTGNGDGKLVVGGRVGFLPIPGLEVGLSAGGGDVGPVGEESLLRKYKVYGADFVWGKKAWEVRGEYVKSKLGSNAASAAPDSAQWQTWYVQGAYRFLPSKWEAVLRYTDYNANNAENSQEQWGVGVNYWFAPNAVAKLGYEFNDGLSGEPTDDNRLLLQLAYGF